MGRGGKRATHEGEMRARLEKWERSGLPLSRFADREGIARKTMYRWRRRLRVGDDRVRRGRPPVASVGGGEGERSQAASIFTEVSSAVRTASAAVIFEVVLRSGTTVRVPEHFDPGALSLLLQTLRGC